MAFAAVLAAFSFVAFGLLQYTEQGLVLLVACQGATRSARLFLKMLRQASVWARRSNLRLWLSLRFWPAFRLWPSLFFNLPSRGAFCLLGASGQREMRGCRLKCCFQAGLPARQRAARHARRRPAGDGGDERSSASFLYRRLASLSGIAFLCFSDVDAEATIAHCCLVLVHRCRDVDAPLGLLARRYADASMCPSINGLSDVSIRRSSDPQVHRSVGLPTCRSRRASDPCICQSVDPPVCPLLDSQIRRSVDALDHQWKHLCHERFFRK